MDTIVIGIVFCVYSLLVILWPLSLLRALLTFETHLQPSELSGASKGEVVQMLVLALWTFLIPWIWASQLYTYMIENLLFSDKVQGQTEIIQVRAEK